MDGNGDGGGPSHPWRAPNSPLVDCYHPAHNNRADHVSAGMPLSELYSHNVGIWELALCVCVWGRMVLGANRLG